MSQRLQGLDLARFGAFVGMTVVNFSMAMGSSQQGWLLLQHALAALQGRAAASFVVLAGIGLGLAAARQDWQDSWRVTWRRALFLWLAGMLNLLIFEADILHYYACFFLLGVLCLRLANRALWALMLLLPALAVWVQVTGLYNQGWHWASWQYVDFWTVAGFMRHLLFNGWHPLLPWFSFFLLGLWLSRLPLTEARLQQRMVWGGGLALTSAVLLSHLLTRALAAQGELAWMLDTGPLPPSPLFVLGGCGAACLLIGCCLILHRRYADSPLLPWLIRPGQQTLTLYLTHILLGMGALEALDLLQGQSLNLTWLLALGFALLAILYAWLWRRWFQRGPLEALMRRVAG
ncbi:heparan-alpha-glucosaminide N-acetyltransferase domain-containing protein [Leeia aquatica]|uniref:DUF418 domain-containing protein n=1 Tax=Leeia aquatica TaxID=2725557 RepID=A0A847S3F6_9NEIS|nr:DUF418 domain-containing protein [Leeia aquatica]NLR74333.1 DUF418 domain-containing protein [Leeia aquatica]